MRIANIPVLLCALFSFFSLTGRSAAFYLHDGDRVVFYGDSITEHRHYAAFVETYVVTRFPGLRVAFVNSGVGGDTVAGGPAGPIQVRLERDIVAQKPTVLTIMLGMNDAKYRAFDEPLFQAYKSGLEHIVTTAKSELPGIRITLAAPSPFDDVTQPPQFPGGYNGVLVRYGQYVRELAQRDTLGFADLNAPLVSVLSKALAADSEAARRIISDRVHPAAAGHLIMAEALLKSWNAPSLVTAVSIDAPADRVAHAENTQVSEFRSDSGLHWVQKDGALPFPMDKADPAIALVLRCSDAVEALDQENLQVSGLAGGRYLLKIDDQEIGTFSSSQLGNGINLAELATPMTKQAEIVHGLTLKRHNVRAVRWRLVQVALEDENLAHKGAALEDLDLLEEELIKRQHDAAQPRPHRYSLTPAAQAGGTGGRH